MKIIFLILVYVILVIHGMRFYINLNRLLILRKDTIISLFHVNDGTKTLQMDRLDMGLKKAPFIVFLSNDECLSEASKKHINAVAVYNFSFTNDEREKYRSRSRPCGEVRETRQPRPWVVNTMPKVIQNLKSQMKNQVINSDTGSGKSDFIQMLLNNLPREFTAAIVVTPLKQLNAQMLSDLCHVRQGMNCLDSDTSGQKRKASGEDETFLKQEIIKWISSFDDRNADVKHIIATHKSIISFGDFLINSRYTYLVIVDEHFKFTYDETFVRMQNAPNIYWIFLSATLPSKIKNKQAKAIMDEAHKNAFTFGKAECVKCGYTLPIDFYIVKENGEKFYENVANELCLNNSKVVACFTSDSKAAKFVTSIFETVFTCKNVTYKIYSIYTSGNEYVKKQREKAIKNVKNNIDEVDITILLLVQIGRYGLNCPPIDTVVIGCPLEDSQMMAEDFLKQESERAGRCYGNMSHGKTYLPEDKMDVVSRYMEKYDPNQEFSRIYEVTSVDEERTVLSYIVREPSEKLIKVSKDLSNGRKRQFLLDTTQESFEMKVEALIDQYPEKHPREKANIKVTHGDITEFISSMSIKKSLKDTYNNKTILYIPDSLMTAVTECSWLLKYLEQNLHRTVKNAFLIAIDDEYLHKLYYMPFYTIDINEVKSHIEMSMINGSGKTEALKRIQDVLEGRLTFKRRSGAMEGKCEIMDYTHLTDANGENIFPLKLNTNLYIYLNKVKLEAKNDTARGQYQATSSKLIMYQQIKMNHSKSGSYQQRITELSKAENE